MIVNEKQNLLFGAVDEDIVYAKLGSMVEGAALASKELWG